MRCLGSDVERSLEMIVALLAEDAKLEEEIVEFLRRRSIYELRPASLDDDVAVRLDANRHYMITGPFAEATLSRLKSRSDFRLVTAGAGLRDRLTELRADLGPDVVMHMESASEEELEKLKELVIEAMSSFERPDWDTYFMEIARVVARRGNCMKRQIAAVVVRDHRIICTGYNGTPRGARNCNEGGCPRCNSLAPSGTDLDDCICNHAEENAITQAAYHGISIKGATMYCTYSPCLHCTKLIINAGIEEVVYNADYPMADRSLSLLAECGVRARRFPLVD